MCRFIIQNKIRNADDLLLFEEDGSYYNDDLSERNKIVFTRG